MGTGDKEGKAVNKGALLSQLPLVIMNVIPLENSGEVYGIHASKSSDVRGKMVSV